MATRDLASISASLQKVFDDDIVSSINRAVLLGQLLPTRPAKSDVVTWVNRFSDPASTTGPYADGANVTSFNTDLKVPAVLQYGGYSDAFEVTGKAAGGAAASGNPTQLEDLFAEEMMESIERLAQVLGQAAYTGTGTGDEIHGIAAAAGPLSDTGIYANIDRAAFPEWAGNVIDGLGAPLTPDLMRQVMRVVYERSGMKPDVIICDPFQHEAYGRTFGANRTYRQDVKTRNGIITLDGGYQALDFDGIQVIEDVQAQPGEMYFLNTGKMYWSQLPDPGEVFGGKGGMELMGSDEKQYGEGKLPLRARVNYLGKQGDKLPVQLVLYPSLVSRRQNCHARLTNLATS